MNAQRDVVTVHNLHGELWLDGPDRALALIAGLGDAAVWTDHLGRVHLLGPEDEAAAFLAGLGFDYARGRREGDAQ